MKKLIAFAGYARSGKDEAAKPLIARGYQRRAFGDYIKQDLDWLVRERFGFSAFTEVDAEKAKIRRTLENWGEDNYDNILRRFLADLPELAVNTRLVRTREAEAWRSRGGVIVEIVRPGAQPATQWEHDRLQELRDGGFIDAEIFNEADIEHLHDRVLTYIYR
jgi:hypothetical protein